MWVNFGKSEQRWILLRRGQIMGPRETVSPDCIPVLHWFTLFSKKYSHFLTSFTFAPAVLKTFAIECHVSNTSGAIKSWWYSFGTATVILVMSSFWLRSAGGKRSSIVVESSSSGPLIISEKLSCTWILLFQKFPHIDFPQKFSQFSQNFFEFSCT